MMKRMVKYILGALLCTVLLFAAGCENEPAGESSAESSHAVSQDSSVTEESSALPESSEESSESSVIEISFDESSEESSEETSSEESSEPERDPIYRGEDEPHIEEIVLSEILEKGFALTQSRLTMELGEQAKIPFEFTPIGTTNRTLTWTSTNEKAVTVASDGTLTAVGTGITYIRATTSTGRYSECRVEVVAELSLSALSKRIKAVASGEYRGLHFALCDVDLDGIQELIVRSKSAEGLPTINIYEIEAEPKEETPSTDETDEPKPEGWVLGFDTGDDEEWAVWERKNGSRFLLVSFSQNLANGDERHVMLEIDLTDPPAPETGEEPEEPVLQCVYVLTREVHDGESRYFAQVDGDFIECDSDGYQVVRNAYFNVNKQLPGYALTWVSGNTPKEIEQLLKGLTFTTK